MKKNLILLGVFILLIGIGFFFEERRQNLAAIEDRAQNFLLDKKISLAQKILLPNVTFEKQEGSFRVGSSLYPVDEKMIERLIHDLENIRFIEKINIAENEKDNFFQFQNHKIIIQGTEEIELVLGDLNQVTGLFYLKYKDDLYIVQIDSSAKFIYQDEIQKKKMQYIELKDLALASEAQFFKKGLDHFVDIKKLEKIDFKPVLNRAFTVGKEGIVEPMPPKGVQSFKSVFKDIEKLLSEIEIQEALTLNARGEVFSQIIFYLEENKQIEFELYKNYEGKLGYYLFISVIPDKLFQLDEAKLQLFFLGHQNFWNKRVLFSEKLSELRDIEFEIVDMTGALTEKFIINNFENFKIRPLNGSLSYQEKYLNLLFNILFATTEFQQAREVGELSALGLDIKEAFSVSLNIFERKFEFYFFEKRILLVDTMNEIFFRYEYDLGEFQPSKFEDFIKGKK